MSEAIVKYHDLSSLDDICYRKSGLYLALIVVVTYVVLFIQGKHYPAVLFFAAILSLAAWFEFWPLRKAVDLLIRIGNVMHRFTNPLLFALIYIVAVVPTALVLKMFSKDVLSLKYDNKCSTYWVARQAGNLWKESFRNQF
jgi:nicotinamide riboside transporter PnuC